MNRILYKHLVIIITICFMATLLQAQNRQLPVLKLPVGHTAHVSSIDVTADGKLIATASHDNQVIIWDANTGKALRGFSLKKPLFKVRFSADGKQLVVIENTVTIMSSWPASLWDVKTGNKIRDFNFLGSEDIEVSPVNNLMIVPGYKSAAPEEEDEDKETDKDEEDEDDGLMKALLGNFKTAVIRNDSASLFNFVLNKKVASFKTGGNSGIPGEETQPAKFTFLPTSKELFCISASNTSGRNGNFLVEIWNTADMRKPIRTITGEGSINTLAAASTGGYFAVAVANKISLGNMDSKDWVDHFVAAEKKVIQLQVIAKNKWLMSLSKTDKVKTLEIWDIGTRTKIFTQSLTDKTADEADAKIAPDANYIAVTNKGEVGLFDFNGHLLRSLKGLLINTYSFCFTKNDAWLVPKMPAKEASRTYLQQLLAAIRPDSEDNAEEKEEKKQMESLLKAEIYKLDHGVFKMPVWDLETGTGNWVPVQEKNLLVNGKSIQQGNDTISANKRFILLNNPYTPDLGIAWAAITSGIGAGMKKAGITAGDLMKPSSKVKYLVNRQLKDTLQLVTLDSVNWIIINSKGYFKSSRDAAPLLYYKTSDDHIISFSQLDLRYNRPDLVLQSLGSNRIELIDAYKKTWQTRMARYGFKEDAFESGYIVPAAEYSVEENAAGLLPGSIKLRFRSANNKVPLRSFNVWINEVPVFGYKGMLVSDKQKINFDTTVTINLGSGSNKIEAAILNNNGLESYRSALYRDYFPARQTAAKTWFIGMGVKKYADPLHNNLKYTIEDIRSIANAIKQKLGDNVSIDTLFNTDFNSENIQSIKAKLTGAAINDRVILFYSGHGVLANGKYYLPVSNMNGEDFNAPEKKSVSYELLESLLDGVPPRNKLFLIDACHSGVADSNDIEVKTDTSASTTTSLLMEELFTYVGNGTGATVITSSAGHEKSLESAELKHGFFTQVILNALKEYKTITVADLKDYVIKQVPLISSKRQTPTIRSMNWELNFKVW